MDRQTSVHQDSRTPSQMLVKFERIFPKWMTEDADKVPGRVIWAVIAANAKYLELQCTATHNLVHLCTGT
jgi:hypothetical protein